MDYEDPNYPHPDPYYAISPLPPDHYESAAFRQSAYFQSQQNLHQNLHNEASSSSTPHDEGDDNAFGPRSGHSSARQSYLDNNPYTSYSYPLSRPPAARRSSRSLYGPYSQSPPDSRSIMGTPSPVPWGDEKGVSSVSPSPIPWGNEKDASTMSLVPLAPYGSPNPYRSSDMQATTIPEHKTTASGVNIAKLSDNDDDGRLSSWRQLCWWLSPIASALTLSAYWIYFVLRVMYINSAQKATHQTLPLAWTFVGIEMTVAIPVFLQNFWSLFIWKKRNRPRLRLEGNDCPTIDVLITCCKEDVDLVVDTARAACELDYPADRFRVMVLDDGADPDLRRALSSLEDRYPNLYYRAREKIKGVPHHFKAGNLNYGIKETQNMPGGGGELIAALDADMIPEAHWLRAVVPHVLTDPKCAMACPPQLFYNIPKGDPLCQSLDFFVHVSEPIKDALGVAWCTGSGYVVRRNALVEIGCFPQGSLAEDVCTSTLLLGRGWSTAYVHEPLQFGTVPDSFGSHLKQRTRWAIGTVDTALKLKFCLYGAEIAKMKFWPRLSGFIYAVTAMFNIFFVCSLFALPIVLISGRPLIAYADAQELHNLIYACFFTVIANRLCDFVMFAPAGYTTGQRGARAQLWMSPYFAICMVRSFVLPSWLGGQAQSFKPTGSIKSELNERDAQTRAPLHRRLVVVLFSYLSILHVLYVYFVLSAVTVATSRCVVAPPAYLFKPLSQASARPDPTNTNLSTPSFTRAQFQCLLTHAFWPPVSWLMVIASFWMPIQYIINPPDVPAREDLLDRDPKTEVARPKEEYKKAGWNSSEFMLEFIYTCVTIFTCFIFAIGFFWL